MRGGDTERGSVSVFTNIATNLVRSWLRIGLEDDNILIGRSEDTSRCLGCLQYVYQGTD